MKTETETTKKVEVKDSLLEVVRILRLFPEDELSRIIAACEAAGSYQGLISQSFGRMAQNVAMKERNRTSLDNTALVILQGLLANGAGPGTDRSDAIAESFELAVKFNAFADKVMEETGK